LKSKTNLHAHFLSCNKLATWSHPLGANWLEHATNHYTTTSHQLTKQSSRLSLPLRPNIVN
jgi:hypothetical protein